MVTAMKTSPLSPTVHPEGEASRLPSTPLPVDTYGGRIHVEWDPQAAVTPLGQLPFFYRISQNGGAVCPLGAGLSVEVSESQCPAGD